MVVPMAPIGLIAIIALVLYLIVTFLYGRRFFKRVRLVFLMQLGNILLFPLSCSVFFMLINYLYSFEGDLIGKCFVCGVLVQLLFFIVFSVIYSFLVSFLVNRFLRRDLKIIFLILFSLPLSFIFLFILFFIIYSF